jgi:hypothetical protein
VPLPAPIGTRADPLADRQPCCTRIARVTFTVGGLPAHPILIHAVVVLIPLAALGAIAVAIRPRWNRAYAPLVAFSALAAAFTATVAMLAGNELLIAINPSPSYVALLDEHGRFGLYTVYASWFFAVFAVATAVLGRRGPGSALRLAGALSALIGLAALVLVVITGDLGATSVWGHLTGAAP